LKQERHNAIRQLVAGKPILNQDELRLKLIQRGIDVTQATLSRDIHELNLMKGPNGYALPATVANDEEDEDVPSLQEVLYSFGLKVRSAQNQVILITTIGGAQPVAAAIDHEEFDEVLGTLAGDNTVLILCPDQRTASQLRTRLEVMVG
jgi:transcriptional regulator of arginine metabolism